MATAGESRLGINSISWPQYEALCKVFADRSLPRMTYDRGTLEFMTPSFEHELRKAKLDRVTSASASRSALRF